MPKEKFQAGATYLVNHTLLSTGHAGDENGGEVFPIQDDGVSVIDKFGSTVTVDFDRLLSLYAIRKATDDEVETMKSAGTLKTDGVYQGDAPDGTTRVSSDTFAPVDSAQVTFAGPDQSRKSGKG